jgi:alpha-tubulin suppressor-like RCC1 family protein
MRVPPLAPLVVVAACGRWRFDPVQTSADAARLCSTDLDCGMCTPCVAGTCGPAQQPSQLFVGHRTTCFLDAEGSRWCVGEGNGPFTQDGVPSRLPGDTGWTELFLGWHNAFGWQQGMLEYFGDNSMTSTASSDTTWAQITITDYNNCFRHAAGDAMCNNGPVAGSWTTLMGGSYGICGVQSDGSLWCWGTDYSGTLGHGVEPDGTVIPAPSRVGTANDWLDATNGLFVTCALKTDHTLWCMGRPDSAGAGGVDPMGMPIQISPDTDWTWVSTRWDHGCAGKPDGRVFCWGTDDNGLQVLPGQVNVAVPTEIVGYRFDQFLLGGHHYCATQVGDPRWYCWGWNGRGQLATGDTTDHQAPTLPVCTSG